MNPARNAYEMVRTRDLKSCNRCNESGLAWVKLKSGKFALVHTSALRPVWAGHNQRPEAPQGFVYANKLHFHHCNETRLLDLYRQLDDLKTDGYRNLNNYIFDTYGKIPANWPDSAALEMQAMILKIEHVINAAKSEMPKFFEAA